MGFSLSSSYCLGVFSPLQSCFVSSSIRISTTQPIMQHKRLAAGLLAAFAAFATAEGESDVAQLTKDTFDDFVKGNELVLAEFFAPWCGHCKALAPEYEEAATSLKEKDIKLAKIDCTEEADLCKEYGVEGYPTLKVFRGLDNISPYTGQRKAPAITSYMVKQSLPAVSDLTKDTLEDFKTADKVVLVAYTDESDKASNDVFSAVAGSLRDTYLFGGVKDAAVAAAEGVKAPAIVLYKAFDEGKNTFVEKFEEEAIKAFAETPEEREELGGKIRDVAEKYKGKINFATIDAKSFGAHAGNLNLKTDKFPAFAIQDPEKNQKFPFDQDSEITHDAIAKFTEDFAAGKIEPSIKSEPIPETQEGVTVVVAKNYKDIVLDDTKDVLIEFYAPWCGHCKALAPKYDDLAAQYAASEFKDKVVIAKVDATQNDVPDEIQGFPPIKMYPAGGKDEPITYKGSRTVDDLIKFIEENGKYKAGISPSEAEAAPAASEKAEEKKEDAKDEL